MNTPDFRFTLISDIDRITTLGAIGTEWFVSNVNGGAVWTNGTGKIEVNDGVLTFSETIGRNVGWTAGKKILVNINYINVNASQIGISLNPVGDGDIGNVYLFNAPSASTPRILTCTFEAGSDPNIYLYVTNVLVVSIAFSFNQILIQEIDELIRIVRPGGWKGLTKSLDRIPKYWGFSETLEGTIDLFGEDYQWLKTYLVPNPDKKFKCKVEISVGGAAFQHYFTGLLDTLSLVSPGINRDSAISTYRASIAFLKENEWSKFTSYFDTILDVTYFKDLTGLDVIDSKGVMKAYPVPGYEPRLNLRFDSTLNSSLYGVPNELSPGEIVSLGFGDIIAINDGFNTFVGKSRQSTLSVDVGRIMQFTGTIEVNFTADAGIDFAATLSDPNVYVVLTSGVEYDFVFNTDGMLGSDGVKQFSIRIRNTAGTAGEYTITAGTTSRLNVVAVVEYDVAPNTVMPLMLLKAYLGRVLGDYDNLETPVFDDDQRSVSASTTDTALQNPPPRFAPYYFYTSTTTELMPAGNYYIGNPVDWQKDVTEFVIVAAAGTISNLLLARFTIASGADIRQTTYATKGNYIINANVSAVSGGGDIEIFGTIDDDLYSLGSFTPVMGSQIIPITIDRYYDGIGIVANDLDITMSFVALYTTGTIDSPRGKYAMNVITTALEIKSFNTRTLFQLRQTMGTVIDGLCKLFGLGIETVSVNGRAQIVIDEVSEFFLTDSALPVYAEEFEISLDPDIVRDVINVGGPAENETPIDQLASCTQSVYSTGFNVTRQTYDLRFDINLNSPLILRQKLSQDDIVLMNLSLKPLANDFVEVFQRYRTSNGLTIANSDSTRQLNWIHAEGRIVRRSIGVVSSMLSKSYNLVSGFDSSNVEVDDGTDNISTGEPIFSAPFFTPYLITLNTAMTNEEYNSMYANRRSYQSLRLGAVDHYFYIKSLKYNAPTGKAIILGWLKNAEDFL